MTQSELTKIFNCCEKARANGVVMERWGSNRSENSDTLWDQETDTHWERENPDGEWQIVPPLGG
jgi:hypothetical protein